MPNQELQSLLQQLSPKLNEGAYVYCTVPEGFESKAPVLAGFRESEGKTLILDRQSAIREKLDCSAPMAWITLEVYSSLEAVGLTAAVSTALAKEGIACNIVAAYHHDHLFVPQKEAERAMGVLGRLGRR